MPRILIVEDNPILREIIAFDLEMHDFQVLQAKNGTIALQILETSEQLPDLIISDISMPDMDGYEFLEVVHNREEWAAVPFIFLTAFTTKNAIRIGKELGADDFLVKPFDPDDLIISINNKLKRNQA